VCVRHRAEAGGSHAENQKFAVHPAPSAVEFAEPFHVEWHGGQRQRHDFHVRVARGNVVAHGRLCVRRWLQYVADGHGGQHRVDKPTRAAIQHRLCKKMCFITLCLRVEGAKRSTLLRVNAWSSVNRDRRHVVDLQSMLRGQAVPPSRRHALANITAQP